MRRLCYVTSTRGMHRIIDCCGTMLSVCNLPASRPQMCTDGGQCKRRVCFFAHRCVHVFDCFVAAELVG